MKDITSEKKIMQYNALSITTRSRIVENPKRWLKIIQDARYIGAPTVHKTRLLVKFIFSPKLNTHSELLTYMYALLRSKNSDKLIR